MINNKLIPSIRVIFDLPLFWMLWVQITPRYVMTKWIMMQRLKFPQSTFEQCWKHAKQLQLHFIVMFVHLSVCQMCELWQNERNLCRHSYTTWKTIHFSFVAEEWLVGDDHFYQKFLVKLTWLERKCRFLIVISVNSEEVEWAKYKSNNLVSVNRCDCDR